MIKQDTKLDAVNLCLAGIGREPVPELDTPDLDAAMAINIIDRVAQETQHNGGKGWWFNVEKGWDLHLDEKTGEVKIPNAAISILDTQPCQRVLGSNLSIRGNRVYDTNRHTYDLRHLHPTYITFTLIMLLPFEELPMSAKTAISWRARRIFISDVIGDAQQDQREQQLEAMAWQTLTAEHSRVSRRNALTGNPQIALRLDKIAGRNNFFS